MTEKEKHKQYIAKAFNHLEDVENSKWWNVSEYFKARQRVAGLIDAYGRRFGGKKKPCSTG